MTKIVIDPGHGGADSGAVGNGIIEKDLNLKISKYIYDRLKDLGVDVKITRDSDETLTPKERVNRVLNAFGNSSDVLVISNHINAGGGDGAEVIYALRNNDVLPNLILSELENEGQNIRKSYQRKLPSNPSKDYYFMQRETGNTESITVEYGFLDSKGNDVSELKNNWQNLAEAVVRAVAYYINIPYELQSDDYIVKAGDTLWSIAKKYNLSVDELKKLNNLSSNMLNIGQKLITSKNDNQSSYIVKAGDTLYKISNKFNVSVNDIKYINGLQSDLLSIGQELKIPSSQNTYIVRAGDTLFSIARAYNTTISEIKRLNNLVTDILSIGQILILPK